jgi:hypothetical protein
MPRQRNLANPSIPTIRKWLEVYLTAIDQAVTDGRCGEENGRKACVSLADAIQSLEDEQRSYRVAQAVERRTVRQKYSRPAKTNGESEVAKDDDYYLTSALLFEVEEEGGRMKVLQLIESLEMTEEKVLQLARTSDKLAVRQTKSGEKVIVLV